MAGKNSGGIYARTISRFRCNCIPVCVFSFWIFGVSKIEEKCFISYGLFQLTTWDRLRTNSLTLQTNQDEFTCNIFVSFWQKKEVHLWHPLCPSATCSYFQSRKRWMHRHVVISFLFSTHRRNEIRRRLTGEEKNSRSLFLLLIYSPFLIYKKRDSFSIPCVCLFFS